MGRANIEKIPSNSPPCTAMSRALNATARTPGRKRLRSCQSVAKEKDMEPCLRGGVAAEAHVHACEPQKCLIRDALDRLGKSAPKYPRPDVAAIHSGRPT